MIQSVDEVPDEDLNQMDGDDGFVTSKYHAGPVTLKLPCGDPMPDSMLTELTHPPEEIEAFMLGSENGSSLGCPGHLNAVDGVGHGHPILISNSKEQRGSRLNCDAWPCPSSDGHVLASIVGDVDRGGALVLDRDAVVRSRPRSKQQGCRGR